MYLQPSIGLEPSINGIPQAPTAGLGFRVSTRPLRYLLIDISTSDRNSCLTEVVVVMEVAHQYQHACMSQLSLIKALRKTFTLAYVSLQEKSTAASVEISAQPRRTQGIPARLQIDIL